MVNSPHRSLLWTRGDYPVHHQLQEIATLWEMGASYYIRPFVQQSPGIHSEQSKLNCLPIFTYSAAIFHAIFMYLEKLYFYCQMIIITFVIVFETYRIKEPIKPL